MASIDFYGPPLILNFQWSSLHSDHTMYFYLISNINVCIIFIFHIFSVHVHIFIVLPTSFHSGDCCNHPELDWKIVKIKNRWLCFHPYGSYLILSFEFIVVGVFVLKTHKGNYFINVSSCTHSNSISSCCIIFFFACDILLYYLARFLFFIVTFCCHVLYLTIRDHHHHVSGVPRSGALNYSTWVICDPMRFYLVG